MSDGGRNVLIAGAGIAGPALALRLLRYGFAPVLVEKAPAFRGGGYMMDVWGTGYAVVEHYGLLQAARERGYIFDRLKFVNTQGREVSGLSGRVIREALQGRFFSIMRGDLAGLIFEQIKDQVEVIWNNSVAALHQDDSGVSVAFSGGGSRRFDLVIGADGLHSAVRHLVMGDGWEKYLGYVASAFIADDYPHRDEAAYVSFARPGRQISRYAMRRGQTAFLLVQARREKPGIGPHDIAAQKELVTEAFARDGWEAPEILERLRRTDDFYFDAVSQIRLPRWCSGRVALVGDAAHSPSLLAGAGAGFAMLGAYILAGELGAAHGDFAGALCAYEQRLQSYIRREQDRAVKFAGSFTPKTRLGIAFRDAVLHVMNIPPLGSWAARRMFGADFPIPRYS